jgi:hypothetical protein
MIPSTFHQLSINFPSTFGGGIFNSLENIRFFRNIFILSICIFSSSKKSFSDFQAQKKKSKWVSEDILASRKSFPREFKLKKSCQNFNPPDPRAATKAVASRKQRLHAPARMRRVRCFSLPQLYTVHCDVQPSGGLEPCRSDRPTDHRASHGPGCFRAPGTQGRTNSLDMSVH